MAESNRINSPADCGEDPRALIVQCKFALEPSLVRLIELAQAAGWQRDHIAVALTLSAEELFENRESGLQ